MGLIAYWRQYYRRVGVSPDKMIEKLDGFLQRHPDCLEAALVHNWIGNQWMHDDQPEKAEPHLTQAAELLDRWAPFPGEDSRRTNESFIIPDVSFYQGVYFQAARVAAQKKDSDRRGDGWRN